MMNDAEMRQCVAEWFDGAQGVALKLNEIDSDIAEWYRFHLDRDNLVMAEIPWGIGGGDELFAGAGYATYGDWIDEMYGVMRERIDSNIASVGKLISQLEAIKSEWIGDRLLLAFPALGFFESQNQKWKSAWERLLWAHEMIGFLWPQVIKHVDSISESRRLCDLSYLELSKGMTTAIGASTGALRDADLKLIEERLFAEMAQVIRDGFSNQTQDPPGNKTDKPRNNTQNPQNKNGLSEDKRTLVWGRKTKALTTNGSRLVEQLFNAYPKPLHESYLKTECDFESDIRNVVRDGKLEDVIVRAVDENGKSIRGMWQLSHLE
jgi:hypothetical protein